MRLPYGVYRVIFSGICGIIFSLLFVTPLLSSFGSFAFLQFLLKPAFHHVCHQLPGKSFTICSQKMMVCARCAGIYSGLFSGSIAGLFITAIGAVNRKKLAAAAILPMAADVILTNIGFYQYSLWIACGSGIIFGFIIAILIQYTLSKKENSEV